MQNQLRLLRDVSVLVLIAATWQLWFAVSDFPAVPFFSFLTAVPRFVDSTLSSVLVSALVVDAGLTIRRLQRKVISTVHLQVELVCSSVLILSTVSLVLLNQHCLQPWMYHFLILTLLFWNRDSPVSRHFDSTVNAQDTDHNASTSGNVECGVLWLTASIYVWSAWSKIDVSFMQTHGPKFVNAIAEVTGISTRFWSGEMWQFSAMMLPLGELVVGGALLFRRTRPFALVASVLMHGMLILAVGPWGLSHRAGVLLWNVFFIAQNVILLVAVKRPVDTAMPVNSGERRRKVQVVIAAVILFPAFRSFGYCDTWPAWAVYASSPARVLVQVRNDSVDELPSYLQPYVEPRQMNDGWSWLQIDRWSLDATGSPIYPQDRFQFGVARSIAEEPGLSRRIRIIHEGETDRWTGNRKRTDVISEPEISEMETRFRLNSTVRRQPDG